MSYYFHSKDWSIDTNPTNGMRIPAALVLVLTPLMGFLFLMFLPLIGFYLSVQALALKARGPFIGLLATVRPGWVPGEAHLTGTPSTGSKSDALEELQDAINRRRM